MSGLPWVDKYKPNSITNILLNDSLKRNLIDIIKTKTLSNMIFYGPTGIGKTVTINCIANEIYGSYVSKCVLELNASDDRGIKIENDVNNFCKSFVPHNSSDIHLDKKLIIFDEADHLTDKAQQIINKLMIYFTNSIFVFTCNTSHKIIDSIQSKCTLYVFKNINNNILLNYFTKLCKIESMLYSIEGLNDIIYHSNGDIRYALNLLQLMNDKYGKVNSNYVYKSLNRPRKEYLTNIIYYCINNNLKMAYDTLLKLKAHGFMESDIMSGLFDAIKLYKFDNITESEKIKMIEIISYNLYNISKGIISELQLTSCICELVNVCNA